MKRKLVKSEFGKNVLTLMTGTTIAQLIPLLLTPILTRLFSPDEFGVFAFFMSLITFLAVIGTGRYEQAVVLPKKDEDAINILALCLLILLSITATLYIIYFLFSGYFKRAVGVESLENWLWIIPIAVFFTVGFRLFTYWSNRNKRFKGTSTAVIGHATLRALTQITGGLEKFTVLSSGKNLGKFFKSIFKKSYQNPTGINNAGVGSLVLSYVIGFFIGFVFLIVPFLRKDRHLWAHVSWKEMKRQAGIYKKFPRINTWHALGDEVKNVGVTSTILYAFGDLLLGFYSMTFRILRAPLAVIGNSFAQVFYQKAAEMHANEKNFVSLVDNTVKKLSFVAIPIFSVVLIFGPELFEFVLGEEWRVAGVYAQYLTPWLFFGFVIAPVMQTGVILHKQGQLFLFSLLGNVLIFGSILIGAYVLHDILMGFLLLSILLSAYFIWLFLWIRAIAKNFSGKPNKEG